MQGASLSDTHKVLILGLIVLAVFLLFLVAGYVDALLVPFLVLTPLSAFLFGISGFRFSVRDSEIKQDRFRILFLWISISLIMLSFSETAAFLVGFTAGPLQTEVTMGLIQIPGILIWGFAVMQYLRSVNSSLKFAESARLWMSLIVVASLATLALVTVNALYLPWVPALENIVLSPIVIGQVMLATIMLGLVWIFRQGEIAKPLGLTMCGFLLYLVRTVHWAFTLSTAVEPVNSVVAVEAYMLFGAALVLVRNLGAHIK